MFDIFKETFVTIQEFFETVGLFWGWLIVTSGVAIVFALGILFERIIEKRRNHKKVTYILGRWH